MKLNKISLQIKIIVLTALLILIPMFVANYIFISHSELFNSRFIYVGVDNIDGFLDNVDSESEIEESEVEEDLKDNNSNEAKADDEDEDEMVEGEQKSNKAKADDKDESDEGEQKSNKAKADDKDESDESDQESNKTKVIISQKYKLLEKFLNENRDRIKKHDGYLVSLSRYKTFYLISSILYIIVAVFFLWVFLSHSVGPFKRISSNLKSFQNEKEDVSNDIVECALKFDNFLTTAKTLLQESYSITLEINRKLEPLTVMSVFSDDNVKQFFTDVQEISRSSNYIANTLDSTTAHIQDVSASAQTIADRSHEAATDSAETAAIAGEGKNAVSETIDTMESIKDEVLGLEDVIENLNSASMQIGEIVNTITNIAYQTNLLALNAAIEAARAGEHGQGFSVVADEVKKLAEESGEAAEDISKKIKEMLKKTGKAVETINRGATKVIEGVNIANIAGNNLDKIVASVSNVNKMIQDISNASSEQSQNIDSLRGSIESITGATKITSEGTKRVATAVNEQLSHIKQYISVTKELLTLVQMMGDMLDKFNLN